MKDSIVENDREKKYLVGISFFEGIGPLRFRVLKRYFGSAEGIFKASEKELKETGLGKNLISKFIKFRKSFSLDKFISDFVKKGIKIISIDDEEYPKELLGIKGSPILLYALGDLSLLTDKLKIAVVGTRRPTGYGHEITKKLTEELVGAGFTIVSGMAMGIDGIAHKAALDNKRRTIAVLGCGVDICYPAINRKIYEEIRRRGLVLSEFPPGQRTSRGVFPARNRIIAGLSMGVLITEGAHDSGSLITARYAGEFGRDVFAVPGPITSEMSQATLFLLKQGAKPVSGVEDILDEYKIEYKREKQKQIIESFKALSQEERIIVEEIRKRGKIQIDEITRMANLPAAQVSALTSGLVIKGIVKEIGMGEYCIMT